MEVEEGAEVPPVRLAKDKFAGHVVVVTGAAQGIGEITSRLFAQQGATLVLLDIQEDKLKALADDLQQLGAPPPMSLLCDITDEMDVKHCIETVIATRGKIDVLAHIAGIYPFHPFKDFPTDTYRRTMTVNLDATFFLVRAVLPHMQSSGYGRIVLTSSSVFSQPEVGLAPYAASKAAVIGLARATAKEAGPGVTVNCVMPSLVKTPTTWQAGVEDESRKALFDSIMAKQCVKRCVMPADVGHAVCFLASPEAAMVTGQILDVSGGETFH